MRSTAPKRSARPWEAERDVDDLKKAQYMLDHVGEACEGVISSVTSFGLFVELPNTVEGLIHISTLDDDYYTFVEKSYMLLGEQEEEDLPPGRPHPRCGDGRWTCPRGGGFRR